MSGSLTPFAFEDALVRAHRDGQGNPWFVAKDVCRVLDIEKYRDAVSRLDGDERGSVIVDTLGGRQEMATVSESGLYSLIFRSRKPQARAFRKWVTSEVLPAIRRTGRYEAPAASPLSLPGETLRLRPAVRAQALAAAVQAAKMEEGGPEAIDAHFVRFCSLLSATPISSGQENELFERWHAERLESDPSGRVQAKALARSFEGWCAAQGVAQPPSWKRAAWWLAARYQRREGRVVHYHGLRLRPKAD